MAYEEIINRLTLEQKCALLSGHTAFGTLPIPSAGLPALAFSDGPHGLRHQADTGNHLGVGQSLPATCFPTSVTLANSWDQDLMERVGRALGKEAAAQGVNVLLGPGVNIKRSPLCGRNFEYFSEDPHLAGKMAAAYVRGVQHAGVGACVKHFAANSQETRRQASDSIMDERTLREIYLTAFEIVVTEAAPKALMTSYNLINGTYANESEHLLKDVLRAEWGFDGAVVTDWGGSNDHVAGVRAGSTFEMPASGLDSTRELVAAVKSGRLAEKDLDARVEEAVRLIVETHGALARVEKHFDADAHHFLAREAAAAGAVLLKNEVVEGSASAAPLLPLAAGTKVALIGDFAQAPRYQGAGSSLVNCTRLDTLLDAVAASDLELVGFEPGFERGGAADPKKASAAVALAQAADVVIYCMGLSEAAESEGLDRAHLALDAAQTKLLARVAAANGKVVVLLSAGSVVETAWAQDAKALLYLGLGGQAGAAAALDVLRGRVNPCGRLAETWPLSLKDTPCADRFPSDGLVAEYREGIYVGYRYYLTAGVPVAYPFGHGLSYTSFAYSGIEVAEDGSEVSFVVANVGDVAGAEVAQVYISKKNTRVFRPAQELGGFAKVPLAAGEKRRVTVRLGRRAFRYFNVATNRWEVEGGLYTISVGRSSVDLPLSVRLNVHGTKAPDPYAGLELPSYATGDVRQVSSAQFEALLGRKLPSGRVTLDRNMCLRDVRHGRSPLFWLVGAVVGNMAKKTDASGRPNLSALFAYNMPLRALQKNVGQFVSGGMVNALVREVRGWGVAGVVPAAIVGVACRNIGLFAVVWFLWFFLPLAFELARNRVLNAWGERRLARQGASAVGVGVGVGANKQD